MDRRSEWNARLSRVERGSGGVRDEAVLPSAMPRVEKSYGSLMTATEDALDGEAKWEAMMSLSDHRWNQKGHQRVEGRSWAVTRYAQPS